MGAVLAPILVGDALSRFVEDGCNAHSAGARSRTCDLQVTGNHYIFDIVSG
jgi:hypothetical protein